MSRCEGCIAQIHELLDSAKREPAHSPTEDALIDAVEMLLDLISAPGTPIPQGTYRILVPNKENE